MATGDEQLMLYVEAGRTRAPCERAGHVAQVRHSSSEFD